MRNERTGNRPAGQRVRAQASTRQSTLGQQGKRSRGLRYSRRGDSAWRPSSAARRLQPPAPTSRPPAPPPVRRRPAAWRTAAGFRPWTMKIVSNRHTRVLMFFIFEGSFSKDMQEALSAESDWTRAVKSNIRPVHPPAARVHHWPTRDGAGLALSAAAHPRSASLAAAQGRARPAAPAHHCFLGGFAAASSDGLQAETSWKARARSAASARAALAAVAGEPFRALP
jgi:hypothetical protein